MSKYRLTLTMEGTDADILLACTTGYLNSTKLNKLNPSEVVNISVERIED